MRQPLQNARTAATPDEIRQGRELRQEVLRTRGTAQRPQPPRDVRTVASSRAVLLLWALPVPSADITGWRVYKGTELNLYREISDRGTRQCSVEGTQNAVMNLFVSSVNALGSPDGESSKVQAQGTPTAEAGAPGVASTPPDTVATSGADTSSTAGYVPRWESGRTQ